MCALNDSNHQRRRSVTRRYFIKNWTVQSVFQSMNNTTFLFPPPFICTHILAWNSQSKSDVMPWSRNRNGIDSILYEWYISFRCWWELWLVCICSYSSYVLDGISIRTLWEIWGLAGGNIAGIVRLYLPLIGVIWNNRQMFFSR